MNDNELDDEGQINFPAKITVGQLKQQVDQLVQNYNKLAKNLNHPQLDETGTKYSTPKAVSLI